MRREMNKEAPVEVFGGPRGNPLGAAVGLPVVFLVNMRDGAKGYGQQKASHASEKQLGRVDPAFDRVCQSVFDRGQLAATKAA